MNLTINDYEYHRNGVGGQPFYTIDFVLNEDGVDHNLWAITTSHGDYFSSDATEYMVIDPNDLHSNWRGDRIGHNLKPLFDAKLKDDHDNFLKS